MRNPLLHSILGMALLAGLAACSSSAAKDGGSTGTGGSAGTGQAGMSGGGGAGGTGGLSGTYVLIDDMETTNHGPIQLDAVVAPLTPGYWYNSGAGYMADAGVDMSTPPQGSFAFSALPMPTTTLNGKASSHAARQDCVLNGLYDTCGVGFEFAQQVDDAGVPAAPADAGDAGASIPRTTIPFDISRYKAITFWGMTTTPDAGLGYLQVKVSFPDTDTDPRGEICNGGGGDTSKCYNSYAANLQFTTSWKQYTVLLDAGGDSGFTPIGGIAIDSTWGYQQAQWLPTQVYGINWQAQRNENPDAGPPLTTDIWIDDVYFIE
ncbi:MAG TPA: hypothetical protein VMT03_12920 [Polyangia bacterium]|nr:hypothetical protein [Polyangia bacterium]